VNKPAHVAGVRTENELLLFINGRVESRVPAAAGPYPDSLNLFLGTAGHYAFIGTLNEVRISTVARYLKEFTPAERFEPAEVTLALYHCDEGSGDLLIDSSGHGYHCDIDRAEWVKADATSVDDRRQPQQTKPLSAPAAASPAVGSSGAQEVSRLINRMAPAKPTPPIPETWTLRSIAQWAIELGGKVLLGDGRVISKIEDLPETVERIDLVDFTGLGSAFGDAEANIAGSWPIIKGIAVADTSITDEGLRHLAGLPLGNSLSASYTSINGDGFESFREKSLGAISLRSCQLSPQGWRRLAAVGRTTAWHLQFSNLNDAALAEIISAHPEIETLNASCREVTDASATAIASVTEIRTLVLNTASISDETLKRLTGLKWLKALQVKETRVTAAGVEQLQQALPDCTITWK
jgi:hypothetical protein